MIHTIDIDNIKMIINNCHYYDYIINYNVYYIDDVTFHLINWYKDVIFLYNASSNYDLKVIKKIDKGVYLYLKDSRYRRGLKKIIDINDFDMKNKNLLVDKIIKYNEKYETDMYLYIKSSKWI